MSTINSKSFISLINKSTNDLQKKLTILSSGSRINQASDDAAGLAIADGLKADAVTLSQAQRNIGDASSLSAIKEGALQQIGNIEARKAELATQASNGTLSDEQRASLDLEYQQLSQEQQRIAESTEFNGRNVFQGETTIQADNSGGTDSQITSGASDLSFLYQSSSIATQGDAQSALEQTTANIESAAKEVGKIGADQSRLQTAENVAAEREINSLAAESRIRDADVAKESAESVAANIRQQAGIAVQAQANLSANIVQKLLS